VMHMVNVTMRASLDEQFQADKAGPERIMSKVKLNPISFYNNIIIKIMLLFFSIYYSRIG
jgi:hypothetical protein